MNVDDYKNVSVVLSVHNQEPIIEKILQGIVDNSSEFVKELIIVFDGCTDLTETLTWKFFAKNMKWLDNRVLKTRNEPDVWEVKANNSGFYLATQPYILTLQDDMEIQEKDWDLRLQKPFMVVDNLLGVTGRNAQNERLAGNSIQCFDVAGKDVNDPRDKFSVRDVIVRGPVMFNNEKLKYMGYLDEEFAPLDSDDKDLSYRAYRKGLVVGSYVINYNSPLQWGKTRNDSYSNIVWSNSAYKNINLLIERHRDLIEGEKHNFDLYIPE